jgi:hypothetical protein
MGTGHLFMNDPTLHGDYLASRQSRPSGLRLLFMALLTDAVDCYQMTGAIISSSPYERGLHYRERLKREALEWFDASDTKYAFSFQTVCDELGIEASALRKRLLSGVKIDMMRHSPAKSGGDRIVPKRYRDRTRDRWRRQDLPEA